MSIEKVAAPPPTMATAHTAPHFTPPPLKLPPGSPIGATGFDPLSLTTEGLHVESLSLPIGAQDRTGRAPEAITRAAYNHSLSTATPSIRLVDGRPPAQAIINEVGALLRRRAAERDLTIKQLIEELSPSSREKLPSTNAPDSTFSLQTQLIASAENGQGDILSLYLARISRKQWEVAVFRQEDADVRFPYNESPISADRLMIDPSSGQISACVAMHVYPRQFRSVFSSSNFMSWLLATIGVVVIGAVLTFKSSPLFLVLILIFASLAIITALRRVKH